MFAVMMSMIIPTPVKAIEPDSVNASVQVLERITSYESGGVSSGLLGHSFITVHNYSSNSVTIGHMSVPQNSYITIGTFDNRSAHNGIWYNIEGYNIYAINQVTYSTTAYMLTSSSEISTLNVAINTHDYWMTSFNCSHFAAYRWNQITPSGLHVLPSYPGYLKSSIDSIGGTSSGLPTSGKALSSIAYQTSSGIVYDASGATASDLGDDTY